jgi:hypothetical protein
MDLKLESEQVHVRHVDTKQTVIQKIEYCVQINCYKSRKSCTSSPTQCSPQWWELLITHEIDMQVQFHPIQKGISDLVLLSANTIIQRSTPFIIKMGLLKRALLSKGDGEFFLLHLHVQVAILINFPDFFLWVPFLNRFRWRKKIPHWKALWQSQFRSAEN